KDHGYIPVIRQSGHFSIPSWQYHGYKPPAYVTLQQLLVKYLTYTCYPSKRAFFLLELVGKLYLNTLFDG
ncbi:MAG: hypothetical protein V3V61_00815, partial [Gammaproteobacteria bacterium]